MNTFEKIYEIVKRIPRGKVASYGLVAAMAGNPRWARVVGYALHVNPRARQDSLPPCRDERRLLIKRICLRRREYAAAAAQRGGR